MRARFQPALTAAALVAALSVFSALPAGAQRGLTASGPPLPVLLRSLEVLRDMRVAAPRTDMPSRHEDLARLRRAVTAG